MFERISEVYNKEGARGVCVRGARELLRLLFDTNSAIWFERNLLEDIPDVPMEMPLEIVLSAPEELISWVKDHGERWMLSPREIELGLREKHYFAVAKYHGNIIAYCRIGINRVYIADYRKIIPLEPGTAFICESYVAPEFRNKNIASFLKVYLMRELRGRGYKKIRNHVPAWNKSSLRVSEKLGFRKTAYIRHFRVFNCLKFYFRKPE
jgi:ribosomal protein S18 acetylase RimI-like enzyme